MLSTTLAIGPASSETAFFSFSNIFEEVTARAQEIAKFGAYRHVMEFEQQPFLPPPLVIFAHAYMIGKFVYKKFFVKAKNYRFAHSLSA